MSSNGIIFLSVISIIVIVIIFVFYNSDRNKVKRILKKHNPKKILLCKDNEYVKIIGNALPIDQPLVSPIGKTPCLYYQVQVQRQKSDGEGTPYWKTILKDEKYQDFIIQTDQAKAIVNIERKDSKKIVHLIQEVKKRSGTFNNASEDAKAYLKSHGKKSTGLLGFNKTLRYVEGTIEINEKIAVLGIARWEETDHNFDQYSSKTLHLSSDKLNKLILTDDPKVIDQNS